MIVTRIVAAFALLGFGASAFAATPAERKEIRRLVRIDAQQQVWARLAAKPNDPYKRTTIPVKIVDVGKGTGVFKAQAKIVAETKLSWPFPPANAGANWKPERLVMENRAYVAVNKAGKITLQPQGGWQIGAPF